MNSSREIEQEIQDLIDGHLSGEEERKLVERISGDPELVDLLVSYIGLDIAITKALRFSPEGLPDLAQMVENTGRSSRRAIPVAAAAAVLIGMLFVLRMVIVPDEPPLVVLRGAPGTSYEILKASGSPRDGEQAGLFVGDAILIEQGVVQLAFESGVRAILQGPAELYLENGHFVRLDRGKSRFRVPPAMSGFRVATPDVRVIDLGTEFAIKVIAEGPDEVHVIEGRVDISPIGNPERGEVVNAGSARSVVHHGLLRAVPYDGSSFLDGLPSGLPYLHLPMEMGPDGELVVDGNINGEADVQARFVAGGTGGGSIGPVKGRFGEALGFNGAGDHVITDWMGVGGDAPRTVAFWANVPEGEAGYDLGCVTWGYRPPGQETTNQKWNVQLAYARGTGSRCILNTTFGGLWMEGTTPLDDGKWHHVAAVYAGRNRPDGMPDLRLYVDGKPEPGTWVSNAPIDRADGEVRVRTESRKEIGAQPLALARSIHPRNQTFFKGAIDELYVVAGALRPGDIRNLWLHNRFESGPATWQEAE